MFKKKRNKSKTKLLNEMLFSYSIHPVHFKSFETNKLISSQGPL